MSWGPCQQLWSQEWDGKEVTGRVGVQAVVQKGRRALRKGGIKRNLRIKRREAGSKLGHCWCSWHPAAGPALSRDPSPPPASSGLPDLLWGPHLQGGPPDQWHTLPWSPVPVTLGCGSVQFNCVQLFAIPWMVARQASLSITNSRSLLKVLSIESVMPSNHLILCHPLLFPPSIFPSIRVFSNELVFQIRWPKYWSFNISPSSEYSGLISFRMDWLDLLAVQGTLKSLLQHHSSWVLGSN